MPRHHPRGPTILYTLENNNINLNKHFIIIIINNSNNISISSFTYFYIQRPTTRIISYNKYSIKRIPQNRYL